MLQDNLTEDWLNELIATERDFISKVKFRLTERLRRRMDKARADVTDWYLNMVKRATAMIDYMSPNFLEKRISQMGIWKAPSAVVFKTDQLNNTCKYVDKNVLSLHIATQCRWFQIHFVVIF